MADITLSAGSGIRPYRIAAGSPRIMTFLGASTIASTANIRVGQVVQFDVTSTSLHKVIRTSSAAGTPLLSTTICGVAAGAYTSTDGANFPVSVWVASPQTEFIFPTKIAGTTPELLGVGMGLAFDSTLAIHYLVANSTAADWRVYVTEVPNAGDTNGYLVGRFASSACSPIVNPR